MNKHLLLRMALLLMLVTCSVVQASRPEVARVYKARQDILALAAALNLFKSDVGRYPSNEEGLAILVATEGSLQIPNYRTEGYIRMIPVDPWGSPYRFHHPGVHNPDSFDVWSAGEDCRDGGDGPAGDIGNWPGSFEAVERSFTHRQNWDESVWGLLIGFVVGLPIYVVGFLRARSAGASFLNAAKGFHLGALIYLVALGLLVTTLIPRIT